MLIVCRPDLGAEDFQRLESELSAYAGNLRWARRAGRLLVLLETERDEPEQAAALAEEPAVDYVLRNPSRDEIARIFTRRELLDLALASTGILAAATALAPIGLFLATPAKERTARGELLAGRVDSFKVNTAQTKVIEGEEFIIIRPDESEFRALSATCTHSETCLVQWDPKRRQLECPCHRGLFDLEGNVLSGPPPRPLARREVVIRHGEIYLKRPS
jgi:cytochrome b6-f complex iron-sulfur subunit